MCSTWILHHAVDAARIGLLLSCFCILQAALFRICNCIILRAYFFRSRWPITCR